MKLYYKNKPICTETNYLMVADAQGKKVYDLKWRGLLGRYLQVLDAEKNELAQIRREKGLLPHYSVYIGEEKFFDIRKEFHPILPKHVIEGKGWQMQNKLMLHEYDVLASGTRALTVTDCHMPWGHSYEIDIADGINELYAVCVAVTLDVCIDGQNFLRPENA